jgi:ABC-2 type transport system ATP-binding protein
MIAVRHISKSFGRFRAVRQISFDVAPGQVVGLLGANGAGKTTTIRMITGFIPPDSGRILVAGHDTLQQSEQARRSIGYLPEAAPAYGEMAVQDYLDFRARLYSVPRRQRRPAIQTALERCELADVRHRRIGHLSRGFRQRVGLAAAILHDPPVLVLDEPTSALDPRQIRHIRSLIRELARDRAVLVSSHILPEVEQTCDRVIIMARGEIRVDSRPEDLLKSVRDGAPYVLELRSDPGRCLAIIRAIEGVSRVEADESPDHADGDTPWVSLRVWAHPGVPDLREVLARTASEAHILIRELRREMPGLERIFLQLIEAGETHALSSAPPASAPPAPIEPELQETIP